MLILDSPDKVRQHVTEWHNAAATMRQNVAVRMGANACYSLGIQYLMSRNQIFSNSATGRVLRTSFDPDDTKLRVVWNEITTRLEKAAAATWPDTIKAVVPPAIRDGGVEASVYAQTMEDFLLTWIDKAGYVESRRVANHERGICGSFGVGLRIVVNQRNVQLRGGGEVNAQDRTLECFPFHPLRLILDPGCPHRDLRQHEEVIYHDVWTANELRRTFPNLQFDENDLKTVGQLTPHEQGIAALSSGTLFSQYAQHSMTKGARVYQIHAKDETGRWGTMYSAVELGSGNGEKGWAVTNADNPVSPFGGDGLPLVMFHGHQRTGSPFGVGEIDMGKDAQNMMNLAMTQYVRMMQLQTAPRTYVERRWMGNKVSDEDIRDKFTNQVGGVVIAGVSQGDKSANPPFTVAPPPFNPAMMDMVDRASQRLLESSFRTEQDSGMGLRSHVPDKAYQRAAQNSGQVLGIRVSEDIMADGKLLTVALGTLIGNVQDGSPSTLAMIREAGFDESDIGVILEADRTYPTCGVEVAESFIRYRSTDEKQQSLMAAASAPTPLITPEEFRKGMADLNLAIVEDDAQARLQLEKMVKLVIQGEEWTPLPLKRYGSWIESLFERALMDRKARMDPATRDRLLRALQAQQQLNVQVTISTDPQLVAEQQMAQMNNQAAAQQASIAAQEPAEEAQEQPENVGQLLEMLAGAGAPTS